MDCCCNYFKYSSISEIFSCKKDDVNAVPVFLSFEARKSLITKTLQSNLSDKTTHLDVEFLKSNIQRVKLNCIQVIIVRIVKFVRELFGFDSFHANCLLLENDHCNSLVGNYNNFLCKDVKVFSAANLKESEVSSDPMSAHVCQLQKQQLLDLLQTIRNFRAEITCGSIEDNEIEALFIKLPLCVRKWTKVVFDLNEFNSAGINHKLKQEDYTSIMKSLEEMFCVQIRNYESLLEGEFTSKIDVIKEINENNRVLTKSNLGSFDHKKTTYDVSTDRLKTETQDSILEKPIRVTMVGVEYAGLVKQGGLAEAIEGLSQGIKQQNAKNTVRLIFPRYTTLSKSIVASMGEAETYLTKGSKESYKVYRQDINGVECCFIEHAFFTLEKENPNIYGPDFETQAKRFATFSDLATDFICEINDTDIIHLHDWHVAGIALKLKNDNSVAWENGDIPPVLFTFHNNNQASQGRLGMGPYTYDPVIKGYQDAGITKKNENLFVKTLMTADAISTVSETFAQESQQMLLGEGVSFAVKQAARVGKLTGIINGSNPSRWNPETDKSLKNWKDTQTGEIVDLSYGPDHPDLVGQRRKGKEQLAKWVGRFLEEKTLDPLKPLVTYIGRFDSHQKGLDKLDEAIQATIANGGQFICIGTDPDPVAKITLAKLEKKYGEGLLLLVDFKDEQGSLHFQQGSARKPGIGSLIRASSDFIFMPSRFEPCGLVQFEGWLFGSLAIGSRTGGLADTIISKERNPDKFNGFLFDREGSQQEGAGAVVKRALNSLSEMDDLQKNTMMKRFMEEGRSSGWMTRGKDSLAPAEKYRLAYENAKQRVTLRSAPYSNVRIEQLKSLKEVSFPGQKVSHKHLLEESYMVSYYSGRLDSEAMDILYRKIPEGLRSQLPSPYGVNVDYQKYNKYGVFLDEKGSASFSVFAPGAKEITLVLIGEKEGFVKRIPMTKSSLGEWTIQEPGIAFGQRYYYDVDGKAKVDPYSKSLCYPKETSEIEASSVVVDSRYEWTDKEWISNRSKNAGKSQPMSVYEVHPGVWKKDNGTSLNYRVLATEIVEHCKRVGFTHVELMGILEHPDERSWGYQVGGYFAPNSRMGGIDDFKFMIDYLHQHKIGIILDWVPAHFAKGAQYLEDFDGSKLYEASGISHFFSLRNWFFGFGASHFDYAKKEVREFLISSAFYWINEMHIDGLRTDCVRSILNTESENQSLLFLRDLNSVVHNHGEGAFTVAEEYSGDIRVTAPSYRDGLDFDLKWHVGWMHHVLDFFEKPIEARKGHYDLITKAVGCDNFHKQMMFFSHDQVKKGVDNLIQKTKGSYDEQTKLANLRAMFSLMMCLPGKKLHFMGEEYGNATAWDTFIGKDKGIFDDIPLERGHLVNMMSDLNHLYKTETALYELDDNGYGLEWIQDEKKNIHAYRRRSSEGNDLVCLHNLTNEDAQEFIISIPKKKAYFNKSEDLLNEPASMVCALNSLGTVIQRTTSFLYDSSSEKIPETSWTDEVNFSGTIIEEMLNGERDSSTGKLKGAKKLFSCEEIFSSDAIEFNGKGNKNSSIKIVEYEDEIRYVVNVPALSTVIIKENSI